MTVENLVDTIKKEECKTIAYKVLDFLVFVCVLILAGQGFYLLLSYAHVEGLETKYATRLLYSYRYIKIFSLIGIISYIVSTILKGIKIQETFGKTIVKIIKQYPELLLIGFTFIWAIFSTLNAPYYDLALRGNDYNNEGLFTLAIYLFIFIICYSIKNEKQKEIVMLVFLTSAVVIAILAAIGCVFETSFYVRRMVFNNSNHFGYFCAISTTMSLGCYFYAKNRRWSIIYFICFCLLLLSAFISVSEGAVLAIILGIIFIIATYFASGRKAKTGKKNHYIKIILAIAAFGIIWLLTELAHVSTFLTQMKSIFKSIANSVNSNGEIENSVGSGRLGLWKTALVLIKASPWFGKGLDCYRSYSQVYTPDIPTKLLDMPHNEYLQIATNIGIIPLITYLAAILTIYIRALRCRKTLTGLQLTLLSAAFAYCVSAFFGNTFVYTYPFFIITIALAIPKFDQRKDKKCYAGEYFTLESYQEGTDSFNAVLTAKENNEIINNWTMSSKTDIKMIKEKELGTKKAEAMEEVLKTLGVTEQDIKDVADAKQENLNCNS